MVFIHRIDLNLYFPTEKCGVLCIMTKPLADKFVFHNWQKYGFFRAFPGMASYPTHS